MPLVIPTACAKPTKEFDLDHSVFTQRCFCSFRQFSNGTRLCRREPRNNLFASAANSRANSWIEENLPEDRMTFGNAVVVEHRYIGDIVRGAQNDGLVIQ
jgi:hypothetical protein